MFVYLEHYIKTIYMIKHEIYHEEVKVKDCEKLTKEERKDIMLKKDRMYLSYVLINNNKLTYYYLYDMISYIAHLELRYKIIDGLKTIIRRMNPSYNQVERIAHDNYAGPDWDKVVRVSDCCKVIK